MQGRNPNPESNQNRNLGQSPLQSSPQTPQTPKPPKNGWKDRMDKDNDGDVDLDDLLLMARNSIQWIISWRSGMAISIAVIAASASLNINSWASVTGSFIAGFIAWGLVQTVELLPMLDDLNIKSQLAAMVRYQRKPLSVPQISPNVATAGARKLKRYKRREQNEESLFEGLRWVGYAVEFFFLFIGQGVLTATGLSWGSLVLTAFGMGGVEVGIRLFNYCGDRILEPEERRYLKSIREDISRQTISLESQNRNQRN